MPPAPFIAPSTALDRRALGKYEVLCRLSAGGMSEIFLAYQKGLAGFRKIVVLKSILPDIRGEEEFVRMFLDEAKTTAAFNHPNIAQVFDLDVDNGTLFLAMEFVQGCTLVEMARACRQAKEAIPLGLTLTAVRDTALALHYAHTFTDPRGRRKVVIHRDVAEKNIMVTYEGITKLLDFGIAKAVGGAHRTTVGMVKGTSGYMSPEQIRGEELDPRSDIFSLGVVMHECLTGMRLFHGKNAEEGMLAALREDVAPPSRQNAAVPEAVDAVVLKALRRQRDDRFSTALEFARAIEKAGAGLLWHPEDIGELVQRHFTDRREQTRNLVEQAQSSGEPSGEIRIDRLLLMQQQPSAPKPPPQPLRLATPPRISAPTPEPHPSPTGSEERALLMETQPPVSASPPFSVDSAPHPKPPPPVASAPSKPSTNPTPGIASSLFGFESTKEVVTPIAKGKSLPTGMMGNIIDVDDDREEGVKTVVSDPPLRRPSPEPDSDVHPATTPVVPVPSQLLTPLARPSVPDPAPSLKADELFDDVDDGPGVKTMVSTPFPNSRDDVADSDEPKTASNNIDDRRINPLVWVLIAAVLLGMVVASMAVLGVGPFSSASNDAAPSQPAPAQDNKAKLAEPTPIPKPIEKAPAAKEKDKEPASVAVAPAPKPVTPEPKPLEKVEAKLPEPQTTAEAKATARVPDKQPPPVKKAVRKRAEEEQEPKLEDVVVPGKAFGELTLATEPANVVVIHNGRELGTTPLLKARLPVGKQVLKLKTSDGETKSLSIDVRANEVKSMRVDLEDL